MKSTCFLYLTVMVCAAALSASRYAQAAGQSQSLANSSAVVAIDQLGADLNIQFELPGINTVGFEHAPHSTAEQTKVDAAMAILQTPGDWLAPNAEALCQQYFTGLTPNVFHTPEKSESHGADAPPPPAKAAIGVQYIFRCEAPLQLRTLKFDLIERFPKMHSIEVNLNLPGGKRKQVFSSPHAQIAFASSASGN